jgi:hypothetical protein
VCRTLGIDGDRHWLRFDAVNGFARPAFDLRPVPGTEGRYDYGLLPRDLFETLRRAILGRQQPRRTIFPRD